MYYLHTSIESEIKRAAHLPHVSGVVASRIVKGETEISRADKLIKTAVATGRKDWKLFFPMPDGEFRAALESARSLEAALATRTGGKLAGPTFVCCLPPSSPCLFAATQLIREGTEVCILSVNKPAQALAVAFLPRLDENAGGRVATEGPPDSRAPHQPQFIGLEIDVSQSSSVPTNVDSILCAQRLLAANQFRCRVVITGIKTREQLDTWMSALGAGPSSVQTDFALPLEVVAGLLK